MNNSWPDIQDRAQAFTQDFQNARDEKSQAQLFWRRFFEIFGISPERVGVFESRVKKLNKNTGFADYFWPGLLLIEHKSAGTNLERAQQQAEDYCIHLKPEEHPRYLLVCDFQNFWLQDLRENTEVCFTLAELPQKISLFGFLLGQQSTRIEANDPVNDEAVVKLARLHTALRQDGYKRHALQWLLVRLLFCMFADKTGLFTPSGRFADLIERGTDADGSNLGQVLTQLFDELDTESTQRQSKVPGWFKDYPYVNGHLFEEKIRTASFDSRMRTLLLDCCALDWGRISPAVFGSMFQHIMDEEGLDSEHDLRRELGAHYTSEENILKLIRPLFLDELRAEFAKIKNSVNALFEFQKKLRRLRFLDPACGCGNFLVITYRELRLLEIEVFEAVKAIVSLGQQSSSGLQALNPFRAERVNVDQFSGIEIEEFPARVAQVAMWLTDHQMNIRLGQTLESWLPRLPLAHSAQIRIGDALALDWAQLCPPAQLNYILGNPPFVGKQMQTSAQKDSLEHLLSGAGLHSGGILDFVAAWYIKAAQYLNASGAASADERKKQFVDAAFAKATQANLLDDVPSAAKQSLNEMFEQAEAQDLYEREKIKVAFVSTNSICQGEQVGVLWSWMQQQGMAIEFAYRTFKWSNEAPGKAAVHCVIVGFGLQARVGKVQPKRLFDYVDAVGASNASGTPVELQAEQINAYLVDAPQVVLPSRRTPLCVVDPICFGSMPNDGGNLLLEQKEKTEFLAKEPDAAPYIRPFLGADEFINNIPRYCLWLCGIAPQTLATLPLLQQRVASVKKHRLQSKRKETRCLAETPYLFGENRQPESGSYLLIPGVSSEHRDYLPIGFLPSTTIASNATLIVPNATLYHFAILTSAMHMAWVRYTCGRLKSDYRYSANIVYNNFPWPQLDLQQPKHQTLHSNLQDAAQAVLDARAKYQQNSQTAASLATLYDPVLMPAELRTAHNTLDALTDKIYAQTYPEIAAAGQQYFRQANDAKRIAFLFNCYQALVDIDKTSTTANPDTKTL